QGEILNTRSKGSTALIDGLYLGLHEIKKSKKEKRALLLISDGGENSSRYTASELKNVVREADVMIYSIGILGRDATFGMMETLSEQTGGRFFSANGRNLPDIALKVGID